MRVILLVILSFLPVLLPAQKKEIVAYYTGSNPTYLKVLEKNGSADKITILDYAFAIPLPDSSGNIIPAFPNAYSTYQEIYSKEMSIDGTADSSDQPLRGQLNQLRKLKARHPDLKIMLSIGGWGGSTYFSDLALTSESREKFINACIDFFIKGNFPIENNAGGKGSTKGIFNGFDIDWEFPISGGPDGTHYNANDRENMTALFALFRKKLNGINPNLLLTAAVSARSWEFWKYNFNKDQQYLDWFNVMTYDNHGIWDSLTGHHTNLLSSPNDPDWRKESLDHTVKYLLDSCGVNSDKIIPGAAFYGKGWENVEPNNFGLYQLGNAENVKHHIRLKNYNDYSDIVKEGYQICWDDLAMAPWLYNAKENFFWTYDDVRSIALKARYVDAFNLRGLMFWSINGDDTLGTLVSTIYKKDMTDVVDFITNSNNTLPSVKIVVPTGKNNIAKGSNVILKTVVEDKDGKVVKVDFFIDDNSIGYNTFSPFDWVWFNVAVGRHRIKAVAIDNNGGKTISEPIDINVIKNN